MCFNFLLFCCVVGITVLILRLFLDALVDVDGDEDANDDFVNGDDGDEDVNVDV
jgi:hypothetical protein